MNALDRKILAALEGDGRLTALPGLQRMTSTLVMKEVVSNRPLTAAMS